METKYKLGDKVACAICCGGRHTPVPANLLGTIYHVHEPDPDKPFDRVWYLVRLPSGMSDTLTDDTARVETPDPTQTAKMRHALG